MKTLVVAEKPGVAKDIARLLGCTDRKKGYIEGKSHVITWAVGHLVGLKYPEEHDEKYKKWDLDDLPLCFDLDKSLKILPATKDQFHIIKKLIERADINLIINAGDAGREGYLIQAWIYRMAGNQKPVKVLWASSITDEAMKKSMENLKEDALFHGLLKEAEARAEGDFFLGINYSRALSLKYGRSLSYGRCQTPLLQQIVQRDLEIENFVSSPFYEIEITYEKGFKGILLEGSDRRKRAQIPDRATADKIVEICKTCTDATVCEVKKELKFKRPPLLYDLATLQKTMGSRYGYSPEKTLEIAQKLYEEKKILSYPRTDSRYLSTDLFSEIGEHISCCSFGPFKDAAKSILIVEPDSRYFNDLKVTDHYALIPTINPNMGYIYEKLSKEERIVFDSVVTSFLAIFYPDYMYEQTDAILELHNFRFYSQGTAILDLGYKKICKVEPGEQKEESDGEKQILPEMVEGLIFKAAKICRLDKTTRPPSGYTVGTIIAVMEKYNIGTPATRAEIIKNLQNPKREFVTLENRNYRSTRLGRSFVQLIPDKLKNMGFTNRFEEQLKLIHDGKLEKAEFLRQLSQEFKDTLSCFTGTVEEPLKERMSNCPVCGGKILEGNKNYYCSGYKEGCKFSVAKQILGVNLPRTQLNKLLEHGKTNLMKGFAGKKGTFDAVLCIKNGKIEFEFSSENLSISWAARQYI